MIGRRLLCVAPLLALTHPVRAQQQKRIVIPLQWYGVKVEDNAFTVEMPGVPDHRILNDRSARGTPFALHSYSLDVGGYSYVAQTALYPADVDTAQPRRLLQTALDDRAQPLVGRKWARTDWREIGGASAVDSIGLLPRDNGLRQLVLLKEHRFVSLAFMGSAGGMTGVEANRFFGSLKLA
ncbi:MAG TPA: hypothetical protein VMI56_03605 [Reyranella sp.]|nr:hypothetical protein [Reyranella sp.]